MSRMSKYYIVLFLIAIIRSTFALPSVHLRRRDIEKCQDSVTLKECDITEIPKYFRAKTNYLVAIFTTLCQYDSIEYRWRITIAEGGQVVEDSIGTHTFVIEPFILNKGLYIVEVYLQVKRREIIEEIQMLPCGFEMIGLDPIASIKGGEERTVIAGHPFVVDASESLDRDSPPGTTGTLTYKWECTWTNLSTIYHCENVPTTSIFPIPSEFAIENYRFVFTLSVKTKNSDWVTTSQIVRVLSDARELVIICEKNCPPRTSKTNAKKLTFLRAKCVRNCPNIEESSFQWNVDQNFDFIQGTQFGRNTDKLIIKENILQSGLKYKFRVKLKDRVEEAVTVLDVHSPINILECQVNPNEGKSIETKFKVSCNYTGEGHIFEIFTVKNDKMVTLEKRATMETLQFVLPANTQVFCKIEDIEGFDDVYELDVSVTPSSSEDIKKVVESLPSLVESGNVESVIQITDAIFEENPQMKKFLIENLDKLPMTSQERARQISLMVTKLVNDPQASSDPYQGAIATKICKKAAEIDLDYMREEAYPTSLGQKVKSSTKNLMTCAETDTKPNFKILEPEPFNFTLTTPFPHLSLPVIEEQYPDYYLDDSVGDKTAKYELTSENFVKICEANLKTMEFTLVEGEDTMIVEGNISRAQVTKITGKKHATMKIETLNASLQPSRDLEEFDDAIDVTICAWEKDIFWWNTEKRSITTNVFLVKMVKNGTEITEFRNPNRFILNLSERKPPIHATEFEGGSILRIDVHKGQNFVIQFHSIRGSFRVLLTHFERPDLQQTEKEGKIVTGQDNFLHQEHPFDYDSWYYLYVPTEMNKTQISIYSMACYFWDSSKKLWRLACKNTPSSSQDEIQCSCYHLSILGGTIYNNPYKIDDIFTDTDFEMIIQTSPIIFVTVSTVFLLYSVLITIMVKQNPVNSTKIYILADISSVSRYVYLIGITTGRKFHSGTSSNICIKVYGNLSRSRSHVLNYPDPQKRLFRRANTDWFVLATLEHLGKLEEVALWSDYSGRSPRWFCTSVIIYDLQTNQEWYFYVNRWLDLPPNGDVYVRSTVSPKKKAKLYKNYGPVLNHSFSTHQDEFTAFKKLTFLLSIFVTICVTCLLFYGIPRLVLSDGFAKSDKYEFNTEILWIGFSSAVITFFLHMVLILIFSKWCIFICAIQQCSTMVCLVIFGFWVPTRQGWFWLTSVTISIISYFFILENIYGFIINFLKSKKKTSWVKNLNRIKQSIEIQRAHLFKKFGENLLRPYFGFLYKPLNDNDIKERKIRIEAKRNFLQLLEDTTMFVCYVTLLYLAIFAHKNSQTVGNYKEIVDLLSGKHTRTRSYEKIQSLDEIYKYVNDTLIPTIHAQQWYSKFVLKEPGILADFHNKLLGVARIRQKRVIIETYKQEFWQSDENFESFAPRNGGVVRLAKIWNYTRAKDAGYTVYVGEFGTYFGGGFVAPLGRTWFNSYVNLIYLVNNTWLDSSTSTVMIEFLVYNVNSNLFSSVRIVFERSATGFLVKHLDLETSQFLFVKHEHTTAQIVILFFFLLILGIFALKFVVRLFRGKLLNIKDLWTLVDLVIIGLSYSCIALFAQRAASVGVFLDKVEKSKKNEFINYFALLTKDISFTLVAAFLVFVATIRLWKTCRFGMVFRIMEKTLILSFVPFFVIFFSHFILLIAFTLPGYLIFSQLSESFRDIYETLISLILLVIQMEEYVDFAEPLNTTPALFYIYYVFHMILSNVYLTVYIAVVTIYYADANDIISSEDDNFASLRPHLLRELIFYKSSLRVALARLRAGSKRQNPYVTPRPNPVRYAECTILPTNDIEFMSCVAIHELKKIALVEDQKVELMQRVVRSLRHPDEFDVFFSVKTGTRIRIIPDYRVKRVATAAQMILSWKKKRERRYKSVIELQTNKLNFIATVLETVTRIVSNIEIE